jgi:hypothetical protein
MMNILISKYQMKQRTTENRPICNQKLDSKCPLISLELFVYIYGDSCWQMLEKICMRVFEIGPVILLKPTHKMTFNKFLAK